MTSQLNQILNKPQKNVTSSNIFFMSELLQDFLMKNVLIDTENLNKSRYIDLLNLITKHNKIYLSKNKDLTIFNDYYTHVGKIIIYEIFKANGLKDNIEDSYSIIFDTIDLILKNKIEIRLITSRLIYMINIESISKIYQRIFNEIDKNPSFKPNRVANILITYLEKNESLTFSPDPTSFKNYISLYRNYLKKIQERTNPKKNENIITQAANLILKFRTSVESNINSLNRNIKNEFYDTNDELTTEDIKKILLIGSKDKKKIQFGLPQGFQDDIKYLSINRKIIGAISEINDPKQATFLLRSQSDDTANNPTIHDILYIVSKHKAYITSIINQMTIIQKQNEHNNTIQRAISNRIMENTTPDDFTISKLLEYNISIINFDKFSNSKYIYSFFQSFQLIFKHLSLCTTKLPFRFKLLIDEVFYNFKVDFDDINEQIPLYILSNENLGDFKFEILANFFNDEEYFSKKLDSNTKLKNMFNKSYDKITKFVTKKLEKLQRNSKEFKFYNTLQSIINKLNRDGTKNGFRLLASITNEIKSNNYFFGVLKSLMNMMIEFSDFIEIITDIESPLFTSDENTIKKLIINSFQP